MGSEIFGFIVRIPNKSDTADRSIDRFLWYRKYVSYGQTQGIFQEAVRVKAIGYEAGSFE
jgi:hypothetical protein